MALPPNQPVQQQGFTDNFDKYERKKELGHGNFGTAYLIKDKTNGKPLVYKKLTCMTSKEEDDLRKETIIMNDLKHPNIVGFIEAFTHEGNFYIVMELCDGGSLQSFYKDKLKKDEFISEDEAWKFIYQMASAIGYLHQHRILHRDMKPENILLTSNNTVELSDFGISKQLQEGQDQAMTVCGTEYYLSPELTTKGFQSFEADVWGIGLIIHEILTRKRPFEAKAPFELITKRINNQVQEQIDTNRYSAKLIQLVDLMHVVNPEERPTIPQILDHPRVKEVKMRESQMNLPAGGLLSIKGQQAADEMAAANHIQQQHFAELQSKISQHQLYQASPMYVQVNDPYSGRCQVVQKSLLLIPSPLANIYRSIHLAQGRPDDHKCTMGLDPVFQVIPGKHQFIRLTARFYDSPKGQFRRIGIVDARQNIPDDYDLGLDDFSVGYDGAAGRVSHCNQPVCSCDKYGNQDFITLEVYLPPLEQLQQNLQQGRDFGPTIYRQGDYNWRSPTLSFAVNEVPQINAFEDCPTSFRFCVTRYYSRSSVEIIALAVSNQGTVPALPDRRTLKW